MSAPRYYLKQIYAERYGAFMRREMGPFAPGLNVAFGSNEAGKTTFTSLVDGVLFGWEDAHGVKNTYRPPEGTRSGMLTFQLHEDGKRSEDGEDGDLQSTQQSMVRIVRVGDERNGQADSPIVADIDAATYRTMFSFSSDELRSLRGSSDITARLLSAGSGTATSPSSVYVELEQRIAAATSLSPDATDSVLAISRQLDDVRAQVREETHHVEVLKQNNRELRELRSNREDAAAHLEELDRQIEQLASMRKEVEEVDARGGALSAELEELEREQEQLQARQVEAPNVGERLLQLDTSEERALRDRIDELSEQQEKLDRLTDIAKQNSVSSAARYEAIIEMGNEEDAGSNEPGSDARRFGFASKRDGEIADEPGSSANQEPISPALVGCRISDVTSEPDSSSSHINGYVADEIGPTAPPRNPKRKKASRLVLSIVPCIVFMAVGIALFIYGRHINSLSFTVLSLTLIGLSFILGLTAVAMLRSMASASNSLQSRIKDAQWVMLQDKKRLDSSIAEQQQLEGTIADFLERSGLGAAQGSLRQARAILDSAGELRSQKLSDQQRLDALALRCQAITRELAQLQERREQIESDLQLQPDVPLFQIDELIRQKSAQRVALRSVADESSHRIGQLSQMLEQAADDTRLDQLKLEAELLVTRLGEAKRQLVHLLLARRMLERSMAAWEVDTQPRVYEEAGRLLALITDGRWVKVSVSSTGSIVATNADGEEVMPRHLSLGTCQQLYLALRIALLLTAQDVGRCMPVIADDILVHFDEKRREGAARALAELARVRQVIVFTCHRETVSALREACPDANLLELG